MFIFVLYFLVLPLLLIFTNGMFAGELLWSTFFIQLLVPMFFISFRKSKSDDIYPYIEKERWPSRINYFTDNIIDKFYLRPNERRIKLKFCIAKNKNINMEWYHIQTKYFNRILVILNLLTMIAISAYIFLFYSELEKNDIGTAIILLAYSIILLLLSLYTCPLYRNFIKYGNSASCYLKPLMSSYMILLATLYFQSINRMLLCILSGFAVFLFVLYILDIYFTDELSVLFYDVLDDLYDDC